MRRLGFIVALGALAICCATARAQDPNLVRQMDRNHHGAVDDAEVEAVFRAVDEFRRRQEPGPRPEPQGPPGCEPPMPPCGPPPPGPDARAQVGELLNQMAGHVLEREGNRPEVMEEVFKRLLRAKVALAASEIRERSGDPQGAIEELYSLLEQFRDPREARMEEIEWRMREMHDEAAQIEQKMQHLRGIQERLHGEMRGLEQERHEIGRSFEQEHAGPGGDERPPREAMENRVRELREALEQMERSRGELEEHGGKVRGEIEARRREIEERTRQIHEALEELERTQGPRREREPGVREEDRPRRERPQPDDRRMRDEERPHRDRTPRPDDEPRPRPKRDRNPDGLLWIPLICR